MSRFCQQCGNQVNDKALFCDKCGKPINMPAVVSQQAPQYGAPQKVSATAENVKPIYKTNSAAEHGKNLDFIFYIVGSILSISFLFVTSYIHSRYDVTAIYKYSGTQTYPNGEGISASFKSLVNRTNLSALFIIILIVALGLLVAFSFTKIKAVRIVFSSLAAFTLILGTVLGVNAADDFKVGNVITSTTTVSTETKVCTSVSFGFAFYMELILLFGMLVLAILNENGKFIIKIKSKDPYQFAQPNQQAQPFQQVQSNQEVQSVIHTQAVQSAQYVQPSEQEQNGNQ